MATHFERQRAPTPVFAATTVVLFFLSFSAAESVGFVPCYIDGTCLESIALSDLPQLGPSTDSAGSPQANEQSIGALPERIVIPEIDLDLPVQNPETRDIPTLDEYLKDGPVRYVDSARLGEKGNVLIFAHTSHLPVVKNQMYKAFNRVPDLEAGDSITIEGDGRTYLYTVRSLRSADATEDIIDLSEAQGKKLTLVTCDTLTGKSARFILTAELVGIY